MSGTYGYPLDSNLPSMTGSNWGYHRQAIKLFEAFKTNEED